MELNKEEHRGRHIILHKMLDELLADYIKETKKTLSETSIFQLMKWSYEQTK